MRQRELLIASLALLLVFLTNIPEAKCEVTSSTGQRTGLITTRLSARELEKWKAIEQIVFSEDENHQPLHPTLSGMWEWVETSGHAVYVEFFRLDNASTCTAGHFMIEQFDPIGERHIAVIRLSLTNINQAYVGRDTKRGDGLIPFLGLEREERYAEVLGHELAHAVHILTNLERARMVEEVVQQTNEMLLSQYHPSKGLGVSLDLKRRLSKRDAFLKELEGQAEAMEKVIWTELTARKPERQKLLYPANK
ncbi:MAG: hypothetical protein ABI977_18680 [Acidobacteriota bacterium]